MRRTSRCPGGPDLLVLESTYAGKGRMRPRSAAVDEFVRTVVEVVDGGGRVLVPAFAFGRAQELALLCASELPNVDVLVDGLARDVGEVYERHHSPAGTPLRIFGAGVSAVPRGRTAAYVRDFRSGVVIATSGMLNGGPAVHWARSVLPDPSSALVLVGYQARDSVGGQLLDLAAKPSRGTVELPRHDGGPLPVEVAARIFSCQFGAHASEDELVEIIRDMQPREVMLVHGSATGQQALSGRLALRGQATAPANRPWTCDDVNDQHAAVEAARPAAR